MMAASYFWWNVFFLVIGTITIRGSIIAISQRVRITDRTKQLFSFIPSAILPAFIAPAVFFHQGQTGWLFNKERLFILILASVLCYYSKSTLATILFGLVSLFVLTQL